MKFKILKTMTAFVLTVGLLSVAPAVRAQSDEGEDARVAAEKAKRRKYPGGRDEQELTVQAALPATTRYPEAPKAAPAAAAPKDENESSD